MRLIHRDIKPANIFVFKNLNTHKFPIVKVGDFGIVKWGDFHAALSTGVFTATDQKGLGTLRYMAPEQASNQNQLLIVVIFILLVLFYLNYFPVKF